MPPEGLIIANLAVFAGFAIRGLTGFGAVLVTLPILAAWMPVKVAVPLIAVLSIVNGVWLTWRARKWVALREYRLLLVGGLPATLAGLALFHFGSDGLLRRILGLAVIGVGLWLASRRPSEGERQGSDAAGLTAGLTSGILGGLFGASGPPVVLYLATRQLEAVSFRATLLLFLTSVDLLRTLGLATSGALTPSLCLAGLGLYPVSLLGSWCGERLQRHLPEALFRRAVGCLLVILGASLALQ